MSLSGSLVGAIQPVAQPVVCYHRTRLRPRQRFTTNSPSCATSLAVFQGMAKSNPSQWPVTTHARCATPVRSPRSSKAVISALAGACKKGVRGWPCCPPGRAGRAGKQAAAAGGPAQAALFAHLLGPTPTAPRIMKAPTRTSSHPRIRARARRRYRRDRLRASSMALLICTPIFFGFLLRTNGFACTDSASSSHQADAILLGGWTTLARKRTRLAHLVHLEPAADATYADVTFAFEHTPTESIADYS